MLRRLTAIAALASLGACSAPRPTAAPEHQIDFLASDAHLIVGGAHLVLPFVAIPDYVAQGLPVLSEDKVTVVVRPYGWNDFDTSYKRICPRLKRRWSQSVCDNPEAALLQAMPQGRVYLADLRKLDAFRSYFAFRGVSIADQVRPMTLAVGVAETACGAGASPDDWTCTAAVRIDGNLGAIWTVSGRAGDHETPQQKAQREAKAVTAFVKYAIGPIEDFPRLMAVAGATQRPRPPPARASRPTPP